jgi:hypothetical protein
MQHGTRVWRRRLGMVALLGLVGVALSVAAAAQTLSAPEVISGPLELPKGPSTPGFDIRRLNTENYGAFEPFYVKDSEPLKKALADGRVARDTRLLVLQTAGGRLALLNDQMAYHHVAQGRDGGQDWLATF